jgi:hypothetical protein
MVKVTGGPIQLTETFVNVGVTVIVATIGAVPEFIATKAAISPVPEAGSPIPGSLFIQSYVVVPKVFMVEKAIFAVSPPSHTT